MSHTFIHSFISQKSEHRAGRQFLDEEAELSEDRDSVSSDECDGEELDESLEGFVVDTNQFSQALNGKEKSLINIHASSFLLNFFKTLWK